MPKYDYTSGNPYVKAFNDAMGTFKDFSTFLADPGERQNIRQGAMDAINRGAVAGALGFPVDTANAALNLGKAAVGYLGNKAGVLSADQMPQLIDKPVGGSEYIGNQMQRFGMVTPNRNALAEGIAGFLPISPSASGKAVAALAGGGMVPGMEAATFIGPNAKTWDGAAARKALEMEKAGVPPQQIWSETGTFRGADGRLRQEIDDSKSLFNPSGDPGMRRSTGIPFASMPDLNYGPNALMEHPLLEKAYGNLVPNTFIFNRDGSGVEGSFDAAKAAINLGAPVTGQAGRSTALHELQHAVQNREGFARGGNTGEFAQGPMFDQRARELSSELSQSLTGGLGARPEEIIGSLKFGDPATLNSIAAKYGFKDINEAAAFLKNEDARRTPYGQYQRLAGEAEARATQARMDMTPEQRRATFPYESYDVPVNQLIVRTDAGGGAQMSIDQNALRAAFPDVEFDLSQKGNLAILNRVVVPKDLRGTGVGTNFMTELTSAADADAARLALSPSGDFGGSKTRLVDFYKRFGFVPNKGRNMDFTLNESMRREPK